MTSLKFCRRSDVDNRAFLQGFLRSKVREVDPFFCLQEEPGGLGLASGDPASNLVETDAIKLPKGKIRVPGLLEHQQNGIVLGEI